MNISYQNMRADFEALHEERWAERKLQMRNAYYQNALWYLAVLVLGVYVSYRANEMFAVCVFSVLGLFYLGQNWSYRSQWEKQKAESAAINLECAASLSIEDTGFTETFLDTSISVPWKHIREYALTGEHLFIQFLSHRSFVIPLRFLSDSRVERGR